MLNNFAFNNNKPNNNSDNESTKPIHTQYNDIAKTIMYGNCDGDSQIFILL